MHPEVNRHQVTALGQYFKEHLYKVLFESIDIGSPRDVKVDCWLKVMAKDHLFRQVSKKWPSFHFCPQLGTQ